MFKGIAVSSNKFKWDSKKSKNIKIKIMTWLYLILSVAVASVYLSHSHHRIMPFNFHSFFRNFPTLVCHCSAFNPNLSRSKIIDNNHKIECAILCRSESSLTLTIGHFRKS